MGIALSLNIMGIIARHQGHTATAQTFLDESLAIRRRLGNRLGIAQTLCQLGDLHALQGSVETARPILAESLNLMAELNNKQGLADVLQAHSRLALSAERNETSTKLFFAAQSLRELIGAGLPPFEQNELKDQLVRLQTALSSAAFTKAQKLGLDLSLEKAIRLALEI